MTSSILPPNATGLEKSLSDTGRERIAAIPVPLADLFNPQSCPATHLPWLAWSLSVDIWDDQWPEAAQRACIAASIDVHRRKGTVGSVRRALAAQGYRVDVLEHRNLDAAWTSESGARWDRRAVFNGFAPWSGPRGTRFTMTRHWAEYALELDCLDAVLTRDTQATVRAIAEATAPARCHLVGLRYTLSTAFGRRLAWGSKTQMVVTSGFHVPHFSTFRYPHVPWAGNHANTWWNGRLSFNGAACWSVPTAVPATEIWNHGWGRWWRTRGKHWSSATTPMARPDQSHWDRRIRFNGIHNWGVIPVPPHIAFRTILTYPDERQEVA